MWKYQKMLFWSLPIYVTELGDATVGITCAVWWVCYFKMKNKVVESDKHPVLPIITGNDESAELHLLKDRWANYLWSDRKCSYSGFYFQIEILEKCF